MSPAILLTGAVNMILNWFLSTYLHFQSSTCIIIILVPWFRSGYSKICMLGKDDYHQIDTARSPQTSLSDFLITKVIPI